MERAKTQAVNVTLPINIIEEGKAAVERGEARSFSAWLSARLRRSEATDQIRVIIDEIEMAKMPTWPQPSVIGSRMRRGDCSMRRSPGGTPGTVRQSIPPEAPSRP